MDYSHTRALCSVRGLHFDDAYELFNDSANTRRLFELFPNVDTFSVSDRRVDTFDFTALPSRIAWLSMSGCSLKELHPQDLAHLTELTELALAGNCLTYIDPRAFEQLPSLVNIHLEDQLGPVPMSFESYEELHYNAEPVKADVRAKFGPIACKKAAITLLLLQRKRLPPACRIHKDVLLYMIAPLLLSTGYDAVWREDRVDTSATVPVKKIKR